MKRHLITMALMLFAVTGMMAQSSIIVEGVGDIDIRQGDSVRVFYEDDELVVRGDEIHCTKLGDYDITLPSLRYLGVKGMGDVESKGTLSGTVLEINVDGIVDVELDVDYDTIIVVKIGVGELKLKGRCGYLKADVAGFGGFDYKKLTVDRSDVTVNSMHSERHPEGGSSYEEYSYEEKSDHDCDSHHHGRRHRSLFMNGHWDGVDLGLNMLMLPDFSGDFSGPNEFLELRPLKSWYFGFNVASAGLAFDYGHHVGIYSGIGLGWNNFSFNNPVTVEKDAANGEVKPVWIDESISRVKRSKMGMLYVQVPLMLEIRPAHDWYIAGGVTGGICVDTWTKIKYQDGCKEKFHSDYYTNRFKLDATLRVGDGDFGFFAMYNLMPLFLEGKGPEVNCFNVGFSLGF